MLPFLFAALPAFAPVGGVALDCLENIRGKEGRARIEIVVAAGALQEGEQERGVAHMLEHLLLRPLSFDDSNGETTWDSTSYHRDVAASELEAAALALLKAVRSADFDADAFHLEQLVVLRELGDRHISESSLDPIFGGTILERSIGGSESTVRALSADDARAFHARHYVNGNLAVLLRGAPSCADVQAALEPELALFPSGPAAPLPAVPSEEPGPRALPSGAGSFIQGYYWYGATPAEEISYRLIAKHLEQQALTELRKERGLTYSPSARTFRRGRGGQLMLTVSTQGKDRLVAAWYERTVAALLASPHPRELLRLAIPEIDIQLRADGPRLALAAIRGEPPPSEVLAQLDDATLNALLPRLLSPKRSFGTSTPQSNITSLIILAVFGLLVLGAVLFAGAKLMRR